MGPLYHSQQSRHKIVYIYFKRTKKSVFLWKLSQKFSKVEVHIAKLGFCSLCDVFKLLFKSKPDSKYNRQMSGSKIINQK